MPLKYLVKQHDLIYHIYSVFQCSLQPKLIYYLLLMKSSDGLVICTLGENHLHWAFTKIIKRTFFFFLKKANLCLILNCPYTLPRGRCSTELSQSECGGPVSQPFGQSWDSHLARNPTTEQLWQELREHQNVKQATLLWVWGEIRHLNIPAMVSLETSITTL